MMIDTDSVGFMTKLLMDIFWLQTVPVPISFGLAHRLGCSVTDRYWYKTRAFIVLFYTHQDNELALMKSQHAVLSWLQC